MSFGAGGDALPPPGRAWFVASEAETPTTGMRQRTTVRRRLLLLCSCGLGSLGLTGRWRRWRRGRHRLLLLRGFGNGRLLPAGPLREPLSRLTQVDAVVVNGSVRPNSAMAALASVAALYSMQISGTYFVNLAQPDWRVGADYFATGPVQAIAGIGHPQRFFDQLAHMGIQAETRAFADHHAYVESDLPEGPVLMTEKDAVKCVKLWDSFESCSMRCDLWFLAVDAVLDAGLVDLILNLLQQRKRVSDGSQIT